VSDFHALHSRRFDDVAILYAFDLLELDGEDLRARPLAERKAALQRLLRRAVAGVAYNDHTDAPGADVFRQACRMGLEGRSALSVRPVEGMDQGAEPESARGNED
jgi:ATP-dependent DNA ligase